MLAQRDCLNYAAGAIEHIPGPVLELGLGNGRTYDHLRGLLPDRDIYVFELVVKAFASCRPPEDRLFLGEVTLNLVRAVRTLGKTAALTHCDLGTSDKKKNGELAAQIAPLLAPLMAPGGIIVSNMQMADDGWATLPEPPGIKPGRYFLYQVEG
jgi:hypothetical protein